MPAQPNKLSNVHPAYIRPTRRKSVEPVRLEGDVTPVMVLSRKDAKEQFSKRLRRYMTARGWFQADLAREAALPRDAISSYVNGKALPKSHNLAALAKALGVDPAELMPFRTDESDQPIEMAAPPADARPIFEVRMVEGGFNLRFNGKVTLSQAAQIAAILGLDFGHAAADGK